MLKKLRNVLLPGRFFISSQREPRRSLLIYILLLSGACSLPFYYLAHPDYNPVVHLIGTGGYWGLLWVLWLGAPYLLVVHGMLLWSVGYVSYLAALTGGINSPVMVWMTVALLPAIVLLNRVPAMVWGLTVFSANVVLLRLSQSGQVNRDIHMTHEVMAWAVAQNFFVISFALFVVFVTERTHRRQRIELDESNAELERAQQNLIRAQAHKDEFIASVGHELRTPMNAILGLNGVLRAELEAQPEDVAVVDHIRRSTEQLLQVVNDILDFSQLQAGRLSLRMEEFALRETLDQVMRAHASKVQPKHITLSLEADAVNHMWVTADRQRLIQVLNQLLDNAIKFTEAGRIVVRAQAVGNGVVFEVQDSGVGIAADRQAQIFKGFEHAEGQTHRPSGGTGLGLPICERLVSLQGGTIGVSSAPGQGARFWFQLPLRRVAGKATQAADMPSLVVDKPIHVLLVDDNPVNLLVARMMLKQCFPNAAVVQANGGAEALKILREQPFDLALMDMVMPDIDGSQVTEILRKEFSAPACHLPVLGLTASVNPVDEDRCLASGMNAVIHKPLDERQLMSKISSVLAAHEPRGEA
jgi:signal transduction histidine kinase/CheY-like chemotaxis protein